MPKFKFGGHLRPFWVTDLVGRIKVTVARNDGTKTARTDTFYVDGSTVGQVAYAIEQALTADDLPALRRIIRRIERQERKQKQYQEAYDKDGFPTDVSYPEEAKPVYGDCGGEEASHQASAQGSFDAARHVADECWPGKDFKGFARGPRDGDEG